MFVDARNLESGAVVDADICIIGAGAAGISMAREFMGTRLRVCLIESGGFEYDQVVQGLNEAENSGKHKVNMYSRMRFFGGSSNCWGGNCAPYDDVDFSARSFVPMARWPISTDDLMRYYPRVHKFCKLGAYEYTFEYWRDKDRLFEREHVPLFDAGLRTKMFQRNPLRFGQEYRSDFEGTKANVDVYLYSTVLELAMNEQGTRVDTAKIITLDRKRYDMHAKVFVLAAGIENARLLLLSDSTQKNGIGNSKGNVGRFYMGHLHFFGGIFVETPPFRDLSLYGIPMDRINLTELDNPIMAAFQIAPDVQKEEEILNYAAFLSPFDALKQQKQQHVLAGIESLQSGLAATGTAESEVAATGGAGALVRRIVQMKRAQRMYGIRSWVEQAPHPDNRITLSETVDMFGQRQLRMDWTIHELEKKTIIRSHQLLAKAFQRSGFGEVVSIVPPLDHDWSEEFVRASHFMGSTRMSATPQNGVVDENCKVYETENLYIAGGSVIPVSGATMVTFNLLALAIRLADFIKQNY